MPVDPHSSTLPTPLRHGAWPQTLAAHEQLAELVPQGFAAQCQMPSGPSAPVSTQSALVSQPVTLSGHSAHGCAHGLEITLHVPPLQVAVPPQQIAAGQDWPSTVHASPFFGVRIGHAADPPVPGADAPAPNDGVPPAPPAPLALLVDGAPSTTTLPPHAAASTAADEIRLTITKERMRRR
jgi:hypothetical protein